MKVKLDCWLRTQTAACFSFFYCCVEQEGGEEADAEGGFSELRSEPAVPLKLFPSADRGRA